MIDEKIIHSLKILSKIFIREDIPFFVVGSVSLALQGMDFTPKDVDIIIFIDDLSKAYEILNEYVVEEIHEKCFSGSTSKIFLLDIDGMECEILGKPMQDKYYSGLIHGQVFEINISGMLLKCSSLELEHYIKSSMNSDKAALIKKYIESKK